jgi:transaldolase/glucose-6-phosphate isomerase
MATSQAFVAPVGNPIAALQRSGQSIWLDFIRRSLIESGDLARLVEDDGVAGVTSNPTIFEKAIDGSNDYAAQIEEIRRASPDLPARDVYERLVVKDIQDVADVLRPVYDRTAGADGYASLEVSPGVANDTQATIAEARHLWKTVARPNLMIKVPGTAAGVPAVRALTAEGVNVNITLLFGQKMYEAVAWAYVEGLEDRLARSGDAGALARMASVASFFVSRIDTKVDALLAERSKAAAGVERARLTALFGKVAIANARAAYQIYKRVFSGPRWEALAARGARTQRLLWASTSVKNPRYRDVMYVEELIGPDTVNTMPVETLAAFRDHGRARPSLEADVAEAMETLDDLAAAGISLDAVTDELVTKGIEAFKEPFDKLLGTLERRFRQANVARLNSQSHRLPADFARDFDAQLAAWDAARGTRRLFAGDPTLWSGGDELGWIGWLSIVRSQLDELAPLIAFRDEIAAAQLRHAVLLGMGGSSLTAAVLARTFGSAPGFPELLVLDSTVPAQIRAVERAIDPARTLFIVASKSGSTLEPNILQAYFFEVVSRALGDGTAGSRFIAITDPGSKLEAAAKEAGFRHVFRGVKSIGGRYSAFSNFGMVPAAAMGLDLKRLLEEAERMLHACAPGVPGTKNPGLVLGTILGLGARRGIDKLTLVASPGVDAIGAWIEQLIAESTGKRGTGIIPIDREPLGAPDLYGADRLFVYLRLDDAPDAAQEQAVEALEAAGRPVVRIGIASRYDIGEEVVRWEIATAIAGAVLGINPFDQPDVEAGKVATRALTAAYEKTGKLPPETPFWAQGDVALYTDEVNARALTEAAARRTPAPALADILRAHLDRLRDGDYFALLAFIEMNQAHEEALTRMRRAVRDHRRVATCARFGPRYLHSSGQAYKGGPPTGVFLHITADDAEPLPIPGHTLSFAVVKAAQARGDLQVLAERKRRVLRVHLGGDLAAGLAALETAFTEALSPEPEEPGLRAI